MDSLDDFRRFGRRVGNGLARVVFLVNAALVRLGRVARRAVGTRAGKGTVVAAVAIVLAIAIGFSAMAVAIGPQSATVSMLVLGHDHAAADNGEGTVQPSYGVSTTLIQSEFLENYIADTRGKEYANVDYSTRLSRVAAQHTAHMAGIGEETTRSPDGLSSDEWLERAGVTCEKRYSTHEDYGGENAGETFTNTSPAVVVGSVEYDQSDQYPFENENYPFISLNNASEGEPVPVFALSPDDNVTSRDGVPSSNKFDFSHINWYLHENDVGGLSPWHIDGMKTHPLLMEDIRESNNEAVLSNTDYSHYGFWYRLSDDRTFYYTIVLC